MKEQGAKLALTEGSKQSWEVFEAAAGLSRVRAPW